MKKRRTKIVILIVVAAVIGTILIYLCTGNYAASIEAKQAMQTGNGVSVTEDTKTIAFMPDTPPKNGFVFYPGGKVDADAYAMFARDIAEQGVLCVIVKMPFDLAVFNVNGAKDVLDAYPDIENWTVGGHSLGGVMAAEYAKNDDRVKDIVFLASYPNSDLSKSGKRALDITAGNDQVLAWDKYAAAEPKFPADTVSYRIESGNHSGFGSYGYQSGDGQASISPAQQQKEAAEQIIKWISDR
ncbi:thioesterase [Christensenellaceae bacterium]|nr:thioesterase [Christensenellaceae bacterium]BDF62439.1 thioesterase [Christensenellaceae bacterium]